MNKSGTIPRQMTTLRLVHEPDVSLDEQSDDVLITLFQSGERDAFRVLVERHQERVRNLIFSVLDDASSVDDLAQEVFIRVYKALPRFRFESSFYTWVYRISVNLCRDEMRKKKAKKFFSLHAMNDSEDKELLGKITVSPNDESLQEIINKGLQALPEKFRLPVVLKDIDGLSYDEIAEVMQCEIGTVKSRLSRARSMLRSIITPLLES